MASPRPSINYYEILEVAHDAPQNEVHRAYQKAKQTYSQDNPALYSMFSKDEARELVRMIEESYQVLGNQNSRREYDESLKSPSAKSEENSAGVEAVLEKNRHEALPDFAMSESDIAPENASAQAAGEFVVRTRQIPKPTPPAGHGRTSLSTYEIDEALEAEISAREEWDGAFLQKVRTYKNVSLDKLSEATRVSRSYLTAVEANDHANLPAHVFVRGFVSQTARILGLDEAKVATNYIKLLKATAGGKK